MDSAESGEQVPPEIQEQYQHDPVYCVECELPVTVTVDRDDQQPMRFECSCRTRSPAAAMPERWVNTRV